MAAPLLSIRDLAVAFRVEDATVEAVRGVGFDLQAGEVAALVGESGSGKSVTALSVLQLLPKGTPHVTTGSILLDGTQMVGASERTLRAARGPKAAMIFQEPMTALNPLHGIGRQIGEVLELHAGLRGAALKARVASLLEEVGLAALAGRLRALPHQLSGGQRQRVMIAMALAAGPKLIIADEPTTALDVTVEGRILSLLTRLVRERGIGLLLITHNLSLVRRWADRVMVMTQGRLVEDAPVKTLFAAPSHPYTRHLLASEPNGKAPPLAAGAPLILSAQGVTVRFATRRGFTGRVLEDFAAVDGVDLDLARGETLAIVGESGSGKSTLGLALLRLIASTGRIVFDGQDLRALSGRALRAQRRRFQVVFQDPYGSLSPRMTVGEIVGEGLGAHGLERDAAARRERSLKALAEVGLDPAMADRFPHEFSGGQRQRIAIARALVLDPDVLLLDEPTSALDRSVQAQVVDLLRALQARRGLAYLFISHDLKVVRTLAHRVMVLRDGRIVEQGPVDDVVARPRQAYTKALVDAAFAIEA